MRNKKLVVILLTIGGIGILVGGIYLIFTDKYREITNYFTMTKEQRDYLERNPHKSADNLEKKAKKILEAEYKLRSEIEISGPPFSSCRDMQLYFNNKVDWGSARQVSFTGFEDSQLVEFGDQQSCGFYIGGPPHYISIVSPQGKQVCNGEIWSYLREGNYKFDFVTRNCRWRSL